MSVVIVSTIAIGIGANTTLLTYADAVLLRPLPYRDPDRLVMVWRAPKDRPSRLVGFRTEQSLIRQIMTPLDLREWLSGSKSFSGIAAIESWQDGLSSLSDFVGPERAERLRGARVTPNFFELLGTPVAYGRSFVSGDDETVAIISDKLWRRAFGSDPELIGKKVELINGRDRKRRVFEVIGVLGPQFQFTYPDETEVWTPLPWREITVPTNRDSALLYRVIARLVDGASLATAQAEVDGAYNRFAASGATNPPFRISLETVPSYSLGAARPQVMLLAGVTLLVLAVTCLSVAALLLAQTSRRAVDYSIQRAIGAGHSDLRVQLFAECTMLAIAGGALSVLTASLIVPIMRSYVPTSTPRVAQISVSMFVVAGAALLSGLTAAVVGLLPMWRLAGVNSNLARGLPEKSFGRFPGVQLRSIVIAGESAFVYALLVGGGLLLTSLWNLQRVDLGFNADQVTAASVRLLGNQYRSAANRRQFHERVTELARAVPGVSQVGVSSAVPFRGVDTMSMVRVAGEAGFTANERHVDGDYFRIMGIALLQGRTFSGSDTVGAEDVVVLSESLARRLFPNSPAIGENVNFGRPLTVVGVVGDVRAMRQEDVGNPAYYLSKLQFPSERLVLVVKSTLGPDALAKALRAVVSSVDAEQPVDFIAPLDALVSASIADRQFIAFATVAFGLVAALLAVVGICGVMLQAVREQVKELGIRAALGAMPSDLRKLVLKAGTLPVGFGGLVGVGIAVGVGRALQAVLFQVGLIDVPTFLFAFVALIVLGVSACYWPARSASLLGITDALRRE